MTFEDARYADPHNTIIDALVDGQPMRIPATAGNRHYDALVEQGITPAPYVPAPLPTPLLTRRQLRLGLLGLGVTVAQVEATIATLPEPARSVALIEWQDASVYERAHPLVNQIAAALSLTTEQIDAAWLAAQEL